MLLVSRCGLVASCITCEAASLDTSEFGALNGSKYNYTDQRMLIGFFTTFHEHIKCFFKKFSFSRSVELERVV